MYASFIGLRLTKTRLTLIDRTQLRTKGLSNDAWGAMSGNVGQMAKFQIAFVKSQYQSVRNDS